MKKLLFAFLAMTLFACSGDDSTPNPNNENPENPENPNPVQQCNNVFAGNAILKTQAEVNAFATKNYCSVMGHVQIGDFGIDSDITDISGLSNLKEIALSLGIYSNPGLQTLHGLDNLKKVNGLGIMDNNNLSTLEHLTALEEVGVYGDAQSIIKIALNYNLTSLKGLEKVKSVQILQLQMNGIQSLKGIEGLMQAGYIEVFSENILNFEGLEGLEKADEFIIKGNSYLKNTLGISNLKDVGRFIIQSNDELTSIAEISNIQTLSELIISNNTLLTTLPSLNNSITEIKKLYLEGSFSSLEVLSGLIKIENLQVYSGSVTSLHGLENLKTISGLWLECGNLTSLAGLSNLTDVIDHAEEFSDEFEGIAIYSSGISSLDGLQNINSFNGKFVFKYNANLNDYCAINSTVNFASSIDVQGNAYNPTTSDFAAGNCSQ